ncbi:MAG: LuxR C-terminal-related transcriptional regulator [Ornithinibacter sp.]
MLDAADRCQDTGGCGPADVEAVLAAVTDLVGCDIALCKRYHLGDALTDAWFYPEAMAPSGIHSEICLELSHDPDERNVIVLSRVDGSAFTERDRLVLRLICPIVDQAIRHGTRPGVRVTPRESDVLRLVREGLTNAQIARRLGIAEATVAKHLEHVYARTGAQCRAQAVAMCWDALVVAAGA